MLKNWFQINLIHFQSSVHANYLTFVLIVQVLFVFISQPILIVELSIDMQNWSTLDLQLKIIFSSDPCIIYTDLVFKYILNHSSTKFYTSNKEIFWIDQTLPPSPHPLCCNLFDFCKYFQPIYINLWKKTSKTVI